ncbi:MAG TPA: HAMP domain-containing sensor histidine kinase [Candidatus Limnocylindria bacterium]|nr:HAMP domain-containing sensor histidine kinase [Candidatus Limnocylindria bacterium]
MPSPMRDRLLALAVRLIWPSPPWPMRYGLAVGMTLFVALLKFAMPETGEQGPGLLLTIPVAVSAVVAGLGPALLATAGATIVVAFFLPPALVFAITDEVSWLSLAAFLFEGLVIALLGAGLRAALRRSLENVHRLEELQRERSALIATVTHEFRNPLAALSSHLQLATRFVAREDQRHRLPRSIEVASDQVARLLRLIEDLLVVATTGDGPFRIETQVVDLDSTAVAAARRARAADSAHPIWSIPSEEGVRVMADRARLDQILDNLLRNAARYSPASSRIEINVTSDGARRTGMIRVRDLGPGVDPSERDRIFERFVRGSSARGVDGSGIGLYVSRELARRMGGRLLLEESSITGSVFAVELPLAPAGANALDAELPSALTHAEEAGESQSSVAT